MPSRKTDNGLRRLAPRLDGDGGPLGGVARFARELETHRRRLQQGLPESLRGQWRLARLDEVEIVVVAESPAWATRLRYAGPQIQEAAARLTGVRPRRVTVRIAPAADRPRCHQPPHPPGEHARAAIRAAAETMDDPRLREALRRLADTEPAS